MDIDAATGRSVVVVAEGEEVCEEPCTDFGPVFMAIERIGLERGKCFELNMLVAAKADVLTASVCNSGSALGISAWCSPCLVA